MCSEFTSHLSMVSQPHWFPMLATPNILTIAEECDCLCSESGPCCCHGEDKTASESSDSPSTSLKAPNFEEFDGVDDILAVSHLSEKPSVKKRNPLLRAKTLPAIISPSLSIIQAPFDTHSKSKIPTIVHTEEKEHSKVSPGKCRSKRSPGSAGRKSSGGEKWQLLVDDESSSGKSPGNSPRNSFSSTGSVASQASSSKDNRSEHGSQGSRAGLAKLARLLAPREKSVAGDRPSSHGSDNSLAPDIASLRKANSIDSLLESSSSGYNLDLGAIGTGGVSPVSPGSVGKTLPASPSVPAKLESHKKGNGSSTSPTLFSKHAKEHFLVSIQSQKDAKEE